MNLSIKEPSYGTILTWTKKIGCHQIMLDIESANDWVIILDESIEFGHDKLLVFYGIRSSKIDFSRALKYNDLIPFLIISSSKWTGELIHDEIKKIESKYGKILYAVADGGGAIKKSLRLSSIPHIYDITHKFAWFIKKIYKEDLEFQSYTKKMAKMRGTLSLSNVSHILPPNQRVNSRFMNISILSDWGNKVLNYLDLNNANEREFRELKWVNDYSLLIKELSEINRMLKQVMYILKTTGLSNKSIKKVHDVLQGIKTDNKRISKLKIEIKAFLASTKKLLPKTKILLCTSDIIESSFGKYKSYISNNPMVGITNLSLCLAAFTSKLEPNDIKAAMEKIKNTHIKEWSQSNIGKTNISRRKEILKKMG